MLAGAVIAFAAAAIAAVAYRGATVAYTDASIAFLAALFVLTAAPAAIGAVAPKNFWLRAIYAGFAAGLFLALRRVMIQTGVSIAPFNEGIALSFAAAVSFLLAIGAPLWRSALAFSLIGLAAVILGAAAGLAILAIETAREGVIATAGASLATAAGLGAALSVQIAAAFSRSFAEGGDNYSASADAARFSAAPALFSLGVGVAAIALASFSSGATLGGVLAASRTAAGAIAFAVATPLFMLAGALSLKGKSEMTAVAENRRRARLRPFLSGVRDILPPSSAIAASAVILIAAIVAAFETGTPASVGEVAMVSAVAVLAALVFVSLRTALMATVMVAAAGRLASWGVDLAGLELPSETARIAASALAIALSAQLFIAWRDRRNPRRKTREAVQLALADSLFAYVAAAALSLAAMAASEAAGLWSEGVEAALYAGALMIIALFAAPPLMTAIGALFGRD